MASTIKLKNGSGAPLASDLVQGEPALDLTNKRLYTEDSGGTVIEVGTNPTELQVDNINIDGNAITSTDTNGNITLDPNGTGQINLSSNVDVTGTVTADGLTVDGDTNLIQTTASNVNTMLTLRDNRTTTSEQNYIFSLSRQNSATPAFYLGNNDSNNAIVAANNSALVLGYDAGGTFTQSARLNNNGDISFYEDTGTTAKFFWDASAESLGIGTTSPESLSLHGALTVAGNSGAKLFLNSNGAPTRNCSILASAGVFDFLQDDTSGNIRFFQSATERMRIDSSGNLLVGTTNTDPAGNNVAGIALRSNGAALISRDGARAADFNRKTSDGEIVAFKKDGATVGSIGVEFTDNLFIKGNASHAGIGIGTTSIYPSEGDSTSTDAVYDLGSAASNFKDLYLSGNMLSGGADTSISGGHNGVMLGINANRVFSRTGTTAATQIRFCNGNGQVGGVSTSGSATTFSTSSDYRLKENVVDMTGAIDRVKTLKPSQFNFIADPDTIVDGFLAHEVADVVPEAITGEKDAMQTEEYEVTPAVLDDDGNVVTEAVMGTREVPDYQGIDQSKLVPLLTGAVKELIAEVEALKAEIQTLKGN